MWLSYIHKYILNKNVKIYLSIICIFNIKISSTKIFMFYIYFLSVNYKHVYFKKMYIFF